jgi:hypothetical protein
MFHNIPTRLNFFGDTLFCNRSRTIIKTCIIISISFLCVLNLQLSKAQQSSLSSSEPMIKVLLSDAIMELNNGNTTKTLQNLNIVNQMLAEINENSSSIQATKLLLQDAVESVRGGDSSRALVYLDLVGQQFGIQQARPETSQADTNFTSENMDLDFLTYTHPILGITMKYPHDWKVRQYEYNPSANSTLAGFYSPSKTASELGNISGVSGHFVPYSDIFVFDSKNFTLDQIIGERLKRLQNDTHFTDIESRPFSFNAEQQPGQLVTYRTIAGGDEFFKKIQVYTIQENKVYLISFTSQDASFPSYSPIVENMLKAFRLPSKNNNTSLG